jgi:DNA-binding GntR family transcriptional regulator
MLYAQSERYRRLSAPLSQVERDINQEHKDIMDAAISRNAERAVGLLRDHLQFTTQILLDAQLLRSVGQRLVSAG